MAIIECKMTSVKLLVDKCIFVTHIFHCGWVYLFPFQFQYGLCDGYTFATNFTLKFL